MGNFKPTQVVFGRT